MRPAEHLFEPRRLLRRELALNDSAVQIRRRKDRARGRDAHKPVIVEIRHAVRLAALERKVRRQIVRHVLTESKARVPFLLTDIIVATAIGVRAFDHFQIYASPAARAVLLHNPWEPRAHIV